MKGFMGLLFLLSSCCYGITLESKLKDKKLDFTIKEVPLSIESFDKNIKSGISNKFVAKLTFSSEKEIFTQEINIKITYDLWDELFQVKLGNENITKEFKLNNINAVKEFLSTYSFHFEITKLQKNIKHTANFELVLDPFSKEKRQKIKAWISENRIIVIDPVSPIKKASDSTFTNSQSSSLFNVMLNSELSKETTEGSWKFSYEFNDISLPESL